MRLWLLSSVFPHALVAALFSAFLKRSRLLSPVLSSLCFVRGLELYKEALVLHEKLTAYYNTMQAIPALR